MRARPEALLVLFAIALGGASAAADERRVSFPHALELARGAAPDVLVARGREGVARAEIGVAGVYPNPAVIVGTSTQAARASVGVSIPLLILGQRGAAIEASKSELVTVQLDSVVVWNEVRAGTSRAFVALWAMQRVATERAETARIARSLETIVTARVDVGATPAIDALRVRAERLRADADASEAELLVSAFASELGRWLGVAEPSSIRVDGDPDVPRDPPPFTELAARLPQNPSVRRELADVAAANAREARERAFARPIPVLDLGADFADPTLPATNYRAQLAIDVPLFNQRGAQIDRERSLAGAARARSNAARARASASLEVAYRTFQASSGRAKALAEGVVSATELAARATRESYELGRAQLVAVLDSEKARSDARAALVDALATRANAWIDVELALGSP